MKTIIDLNGHWLFTPTHDQKPRNNHNVIESNLPLYADARLCRRDWDVVDVPGVWQRYAEKYSIYEGVCWFYRELTLDFTPDAKDRVRIHFGGVDHLARVYVNGRLAGEHESPYTAFYLDVTSLVHEGTNAIAVEVDNRAHITKWPNDWGYGVYGGIHREVFLEILRDSYVYDVEWTPSYDTRTGVGLLSVRACVEGALDALTLTVGEKKYELTVTDGTVSAQLAVGGVSPWSPDAPTLYDTVLTAAGTVYDACRLGFREISCWERKLCLNGEPIELRGVCYVYDHPKWGLVMDREQLREDLSCMKAAGANAVRTHYPMSRDFYELCDAMGLVSWIEPNVYCSKPHNDEKDTVFSRPEYVEAAVLMTEEMIYGARRHASVILYGIGNECNVHHTEARPFFELLASTVRRVDPTRLIGYAALYDWVGCMGQIVDVVGINSYFGWYGTIPTFEDEDNHPLEEGTRDVRIPDVHELGDLLVRIQREVGKDTVILLTEFGADSVPGYRCAACDLWSEDYHAALIRAYIEKGRQMEVGGMFVFAYSDYYDPSKPKNGRWKEHNLKGMVDYHRNKKLPYYALCEMYGGKLCEKSAKM